MARNVSTQRKIVVTVAAWTVGILIFFPILWTFLTSFKTEAQAIASPPVFLFFDWTLENYHEVQERSNYFRHFMNSVVISLGSTLLGLIIAIPAAWAMAFARHGCGARARQWAAAVKIAERASTGGTGAVTSVSKDSPSTPATSRVPGTRARCANISRRSASRRRGSPASARWSSISSAIQGWSQAVSQWGVTTPPRTLHRARASWSETTALPPG